MPQLALVPSGATPRAAQACATCRKQKRKCDKALPSCSRCASLRRACDYSELPESHGNGASLGGAPTAEDFASLQNKLAEIEARLNAGANGGNKPMSIDMMDIDGGSSLERPIAMGNLPQNSFPSSLFLDVDMYHYMKDSPPKPVVDIPMEVLEILASSDVIEHTATIYFTTIHTWFSFISRKRMNLGISLADGGPDLALLFLAMKLITTTPEASSSSPDQQTHLYATTKRFLALLEAAGTVSIFYLQAMTLIALYEYGHAIYPAAWMTVGSCVRYAAMLGLPSYGEASSVLGPCTTWTEAEERRRVWWAVHILDRAISLGSKRPFAGGPELPSSQDVFLPVDDAAWDAGDMGRALQRSLHTPFDVFVSPFARLAQASLLVTKATDHCRRAVGRYNEHHDRKGGRSGTSTSVTSPLQNGNGNSEKTISSSTASSTKPYDVREVTSLLTEQSALCNAITRDLTTFSSQSPPTSTTPSNPATSSAPQTNLYPSPADTPTTTTTNLNPSSSSTPIDLFLTYLPARCLVWSTAAMVLDMYACPEHMRPGNLSSNGWTPPRPPPPPDETRKDNNENNEEEEEEQNHEEMELAMQTEAINGLKTTGVRVREIATELLLHFPPPPQPSFPSSSLSSTLFSPPNDPSFSSHHFSPLPPQPQPQNPPQPQPPPPTTFGNNISNASLISQQQLLGKVSPLTLDVLYCGVSTFQWLWRESGDPDAKAGMDVMRTCMERLDVRWRLSGRYLDIAGRYNEPVGASMTMMGMGGSE